MLAAAAVVPAAPAAAVAAGRQAAEPSWPVLGADPGREVSRSFPAMGRTAF